MCKSHYDREPENQRILAAKEGKEGAVKGICGSRSWSCVVKKSLASKHQIGEGAVIGVMTRVLSRLWKSEV